MSNTKDKQQSPELAQMAFAAIDPYIETNIVKPTETLVRNKEMMEWGEGNSYPNYLLELYNSVPTLRSIINGNVDFISGNDVLVKDGITFNAKDTPRDLVRSLALDKGIYGGFALQVIRNSEGGIAQVHYIDIRFLRCNKECNVFYYSEKWSQFGKKDTIKYPAFIKDLKWNELTDEQKALHASSILYVKDTHTQTYPAPMYAASVKSCEIERCIDDYHLNSINNGFVSSMIVNFNNGVPTDEMKKEIEKGFNEKFTGHQNAGRTMLAWNKDKVHEVTITAPKTEDFGEKYQSLSKHSRQQIFTAFRANPNLFGIPTESLGFSSEEYDSAFKLYNRTQIKPVQAQIVEAFEKIYGPGVMTIVPFSLESETEQNVS